MCTSLVRRVLAWASTAVCSRPLAVLVTLSIAGSLPSQWQEAKLKAADADANDLFGVSVSVSGDTALVGATGDDDGGNTSGSAYVLVRDAFGKWTQQVKLTAADARAGDGFGVSVSLSGDTALVGASDSGGGAGVPGTSFGSAYVFVRDVTGDWTQQAELTAADAAAGRRFGISVSLSGDTALVGAHRDTHAGVDSGSAYVFVRDGGGSWRQQAKLTADDAAAFARFGSSVSLSGDAALIGATEGEGPGSAYVFARDEGGSWTQQARLTASDAAPGDTFGASVSMNRDSALIGATQDNDAGTDSGSAYVFVRDGGGSWTQQAKLIAANASDLDRFGSSVSLSGDMALIGASGDDDAGNASGSAYVFARDGEGSWTEQTRLKAADAAAGDQFGISVSLSGATALVGAYGDSDDGGQSGSAYVYCLSRLTTDSAAGDLFGHSVSLSGDTALIGATRNQGTGSAYVFVREVGGAWSEQAKLNAFDAATNDQFGHSVSLSGDTALIGSPFDVEFGISSGSTYVFVRDGGGGWSEQTKLTAIERAPGDQFGASVSLRGETALVGAVQAGGTGSAYVFTRQIPGLWTQQATLTASDGAADDQFGNSVSLYGETALVGAPHNGGTGSAYVFVRDGGGNWTQQARLTAVDGVAGDQFGISVSLSGDTALVGTRFGRGTRGSAYVFVRDPGGNWTRQAKLTAADGEVLDQFGTSVSLDGETALIGAFADDGPGVDTGSAYRFRRDASGAWTQQAKLTVDRTGFDEFGISVSLSGTTALVGAQNANAAYVFCPGAFVAFGTGCTGSVGRPTLAAVPGEVPTIGDRFGVVLTGLPLEIGNVPIGIFGFSRADWGSLALPLDAGQFGLFGCTLYVSADATALLYNLGGFAYWRIDIPPLPRLIGLPIYLQGGVVDIGANPANVILTNAGEAVIVGR